MSGDSEITALHQRSRTALFVAERRPLAVRPGEAIQIGELQDDLSITRDRFTVSATLKRVTGPDGITADHVTFLSVRQGNPNLQLAEVMVKRKDMGKLGTDTLFIATYGRKAAQEAARKEILDLSLPALIEGLIVFQMRFVFGSSGEITKGVTASWNVIGDSQPELHYKDKPVTEVNKNLLTQALEELEHRFHL